MSRKKKYLTDEEVRLAKIVHARTWQDKNPERVKAYQKEYQGREEIREKRRAYQRAYYHRKRAEQDGNNKEVS